MRRLAQLTMAVLGLLLSVGADARAALPPIRHVYVIVLENESVSTTFGPGSAAPFLSQTLRGRGAYLPSYYGIGHFSNDNYIAMISGQAPNSATQSDCQVFSNFPDDRTGASGQKLGAGCVYPSPIPTIVSQMTRAGLAWRDYNDGMGADPARERSTCGHPAVGSQDNTQHATAKDQYATRHNPFVYFHSIIDHKRVCDSHVVNLRALPHDLAQARVPNYIFITPNLCNDGHDPSCANGGPGGLGAADAFLRQWVPRITRSAAFKRDGLLIVTFDEAAVGDATACCGEIPGPGSAKPGLGGPGGGDVGAVLLSPFIAPGTISRVPYNHYTMLRSVEDLFGLRHIGYAQLSGGRSFGSDVFACAPRREPIPVRGRLPPGSEIENLRVVRRRGRAELAIYSVGNASLRVVVRARHGRAAVIRRRLVPCRGYALALGAAHGRQVEVGAYGSGGVQTATLHL